MRAATRQRSRPDRTLTAYSYAGRSHCRCRSGKRKHTFDGLETRAKELGVEMHELLLGGKRCHLPRRPWSIGMQTAREDK